jgi:hypothetical protein
MCDIYYNAIILNVENKDDRCSQDEVKNLLDMFGYMMKHITTRINARKVWFELADYGNAKRKNVAEFSLMLEMQKVDGKEQWLGIFTYMDKELRCLGKLEKVNYGNE